LYQKVVADLLRRKIQSEIRGFTEHIFEKTNLKAKKNYNNVLRLDTPPCKRGPLGEYIKGHEKEELCYVSAKL
jgi:hypothetical protein